MPRRDRRPPADLAHATITLRSPGWALRLPSRDLRVDGDACVVRVNQRGADRSVAATVAAANVRDGGSGSGGSGAAVALRGVACRLGADVAAADVSFLGDHAPGLAVAAADASFDGDAAAEFKDVAVGRDPRGGWRVACAGATVRTGGADVLSLPGAAACRVADGAVDGAVDRVDAIWPAAAARAALRRAADRARALAGLLPPAPGGPLRGTVAVGAAALHAPLGGADAERYVACRATDATVAFGGDVLARVGCADASLGLDGWEPALTAAGPLSCDVSETDGDVSLAFGDAEGLACRLGETAALCRALSGADDVPAAPFAGYAPLRLRATCAAVAVAVEPDSAPFRALFAAAAAPALEDLSLDAAAPAKPTAPVRVVVADAVVDVDRAAPLLKVEAAGSALRVAAGDGALDVAGFSLAVGDPAAADAPVDVALDLGAVSGAATPALAEAARAVAGDAARGAAATKWVLLGVPGPDPLESLDLFAAPRPRAALRVALAAADVSLAGAAGDAVVASTERVTLTRDAATTAVDAAGVAVARARGPDRVALVDAVDATVRATRDPPVVDAAVAGRGGAMRVYASPRDVAVVADVFAGLAGGARGAAAAGGRSAAAFRVDGDLRVVFSDRSDAGAAPALAFTLKDARADGQSSGGAASSVAVTASVAAVDAYDEAAETFAGALRGPCGVCGQLRSDGAATSLRLALGDVDAAAVGALAAAAARLEAAIAAAGDAEPAARPRPRLDVVNGTGVPLRVLVAGEPAALAPGASLALDPLARAGDAVARDAARKSTGGIQRKLPTSRARRIRRRCG